MREIGESVEKWAGGLVGTMFAAEQKKEREDVVQIRAGLYHSIPLVMKHIVSARNRRKR